MRYIDAAPLNRLNDFLRGVDNGTYNIYGEMECYSCKLAGFDKKLSRSLEQEVLNMITASPSSFSTSPVGPLTDSSCRKTLVFLILTLNHMYPDYDFASLRAHHFFKEASPSAAKNDIDSLLLEAAKAWAQHPARTEQPLLEALWSAIDEVITLCDCDLYSYKAQVDEDPFSEEGNLWAFTFFFYNRRQKRILCFSCRAVSKTMLEEDSDDALDDHLLDEDPMHPMDLDMDF
mmetsp:Transcript_18813/g.61452  ORF Transcript_18813/g.61452 Transcript_18813/m.61452 type:complete len:232 (+) Transcript_18813:255-950(+)